MNIIKVICLVDFHASLHILHAKMSNVKNVLSSLVAL